MERRLEDGGRKMFKKKNCWKPWASIPLDKKSISTIYAGIHTVWEAVNGQGPSDHEKVLGRHLCVALHRENKTVRASFTCIIPGGFYKGREKSSKSTKVCLFRCASYMRVLRKYITVSCKVRRTYMCLEGLPVRDSGADQKKSGRNNCWQRSCRGSFLIHVWDGKWQARSSIQWGKAESRMFNIHQATDTEQSM